MYSLQFPKVGQILQYFHYMVPNLIPWSVVGIGRARSQHLVFLSQITLAESMNISFSNSISHETSQHLPFVISEPIFFKHSPTF